MSELREIRFALLDSIIVNGRIQFLLWLPFLLYLLPLTLRFPILTLLEIIYNNNLLLLQGRSHESDHLIHKLTTTKSHSGRVAVVTGATSGIGKEIARALLMAGYNILVPCRDVGKGEGVVQGWMDELGVDRGRVELVPCDLALASSVLAFARHVKNKTSHLHLLINNAGNFEPTFRLTAEGIERHMAIHVMATYLLSTELMPLLERSGEGRIINMTSSLHQLISHPPLPAPISFTRQLSSSRVAGYSHAKYILMLLTKTMATLTPPTVVVCAVHPGMVRTDIGRDDRMASEMMILIFGRLFPWGMLSARQGASTAIWAALSPDVHGIRGAMLHDLHVEPVNPMVEYDFHSGKGRELMDYCQSLRQKVQ